jgi:hypothetical protein
MLRVVDRRHVTRAHGTSCASRTLALGRRAQNHPRTFLRGWDRDRFGLNMLRKGMMEVGVGNSSLPTGFIY